MLAQVLEMMNLVDPTINQDDLYWAYTAVHSRDVGVNMEDNTYVESDIRHSFNRYDIMSVIGRTMSFLRLALRLSSLA